MKREARERLLRRRLEKMSWKYEESAFRAELEVYKDEVGYLHFLIERTDYGFRVRMRENPWGVAKAAEKGCEGLVDIAKYIADVLDEYEAFLDDIQMHTRINEQVCAFRQRLIEQEVRRARI